MLQGLKCFGRTEIAMGSADEDSKARQRAEREARLQVALRENLRRRKVQARQRADQDEPPADPAPSPDKRIGRDGGA